jgi:hypothetical protein
MLPIIVQRTDNILTTIYETILKFINYLNELYNATFLKSKITAHKINHSIYKVPFTFL